MALVWFFVTVYFMRPKAGSLPGRDFLSQLLVYSWTLFHSLPPLLKEKQTQTLLVVMCFYVFLILKKSHLIQLTRYDF